ncbi:MAG: type IV toxin-antitoxin system AbiEi family antitoxin [Candidatus Bathyarchaeia archaeon]
MRQVSNIFEVKATRVIRALLTNPAREWTLRGLATEVNISPGYAHAVILTLIQYGYVTRTTNYKIKITNPTTLLRRWAAYHQYDKVNKFLEYYTFEREIDKFLKELSKLKNHYALTTLAGAYLIAPHVRPVDVHIYVSNEKDAKTFAEKLNLQPIPRGGNVKFVIPYDEGVFYGQQKVSLTPSKANNKVSVVSDIQLYVDLYNFPQRGQEAAEHLYQHIIRKWGKELVGEQIV